jgi:hypothetical protein
MSFGYNNEQPLNLFLKVQFSVPEGTDSRRIKLQLYNFLTLSAQSVEDRHIIDDTMNRT